MCFECEMNRRTFLTGAAVSAAGLAVGCQGKRQKPAAAGTDAPGLQNAEREPAAGRALDDPAVQHEFLSFKNGEDTIRGFLARPKAQGPYPAIILMQGDPEIPEWIQTTAARLAQVGFVALVIDLGSRNDAPAPEHGDPREFYLGNAFDKRAAHDALAGVRHLKGHPFVKSTSIGMVGSCFGGRRALMLPTESKEVTVGVSFYGPVRERGYRSARDPRPDVMEVAKQLQVPVQGHYGLLDTVAPVEDAKEFEAALKARGAAVEMHYYEGVGHGFYGNTWEEQTPEFGYNAASAELAHRRMVEFLKRHLN